MGIDVINAILLFLVLEKEGKKVCGVNDQDKWRRWGY